MGKFTRSSLQGQLLELADCLGDGNEKESRLQQELGTALQHYPFDPSNSSKKPLRARVIGIDSNHQQQYIRVYVLLTRGSYLTQTKRRRDIT